MRRHLAPSPNPAAGRASVDGERLFLKGATAQQIADSINTYVSHGDLPHIREILLPLGYREAARAAGVTDFSTLQAGVELARASRLAKVNATRAACGIPPTTVA